MPATINGIGTGYWGKQNVLEVSGVCQHCHRQTTLRSYDTTYCFVVLFVPIIPLGKRRIVDQCSACNRHYVFSKRKWEKVKQDILETASSSFRSDPSHPDKAQEFIHAVISTQDPELFSQTAGTIGRHFTENADVLNALGRGYALFEKHSQAEACYREAIPHDDTAASRIFLVSSLIFQRRPGEAIPILSELLERPEDRPLNLALSLVRALQAEGLHHEALALMSKIDQAAPELAGTAELAKLRRLSGKHKQTGKRVRHKEIQEAVRGAKETSRIWRSAPFLIPAAIFVAFVCANWVAGLNTKVRLVNGLNRQYVATLNGTPFDLPPQTDRTIHIGQGELEVACPDSRGTPSRSTCHISTPFWTRLFDDAVFVVNPDQTALLLQENAVYSTSENAAGEGSIKVFTNALLHTFTTIDFPFRRFPDEIEMSGGVNTVQRSRLSVYHAPSPGHTLALLMDGLTPDQIQLFLERKIAFEESTPEWIGLYAALVDPESSLPVLKAGLARRPINTDWHRVYQDLLDRTQPDFDLAGHYERWLAAEPENPDLQYLLGRVVEDRTRASDLFQRAATAPQPSAFAMNALAFDALSMADFEAGLKWSTQALAQRPDALGFLNVREGLMLGSGRTDQLLKELRTSFRGSQPNFTYAETALRYLGHQDDAEAARTIISTYVDSLIGTIPPTDIAAQRRYFETVDAYARGDVETFATLASDLDVFAFEHALASNQWPAALNLAVESHADPALACLAVAVLAHHFSNKQQAAEAMDLALSFLEHSDRTSRRLASWLNGAVQPTDPTVINLNFSQKPLALIALGQRYPRFRNDCFALAEKLNLDRRFPFLTVKRVLEGR